MKNYKPADVRVVGMFGHRGSGKTSLVEGLLFNAKVTSRLGSVESGSLTLEVDKEALERQTTMAVNVGFAEWEGCRIGLLDTPGDGNFWGATNRALQVVDGAIVTLSAPDGIEPITNRAVAALRERRVPFAVLVTKLDKEGADFDEVVEEIRGDMAKNAAVLSLPLGEGANFRGVISLLDEKAYLQDGETTKLGDVPADMADAVTSAREMLIDAVAAADDELAEKYLEEGTLTAEELSAGLKQAVQAGSLVPILAGAPASNVGSRVVLEVIKAVFPSPLERPALTGYTDSGQQEMVERAADPEGPAVVQIFRTYNDPFAGTLSFARVWSGTLSPGEDLLNTRTGVSDRSSHIYLPQGSTKAGTEVKHAGPGDLVVLTKLKNSHTGDTLAPKGNPTFLPGFREPPALLSFGLSPEEQKDEEKASAFIHKLCEEDPSLRFERDPETKEMLLGGLGQAHIDYVVARLKSAGIEVTLREPKVPYRETLRSAIKNIEGKHKKQSGGHGQYGVCMIHVEPLPRGSGVEFVDEIVGGAIPRQFIPSVEKGIRDALRRGPISGNEVVDLKVTLFDGKYHRVDSSDMAFQAAGRKAVRAAFAESKAKPVLLEPYMEIEVSCPGENMGDVMGDLNSRRARVGNMTTEGKRGRITAAVPMKEILRYTNVLRSITSGRGSFNMKFDRYEEAPPNVQEEVAASYKAAEDED
ncbi:elongation factor G [Haliangium ochraceum]|uniref:Elongation factor G n=1 Tax=Haliangium ochraceum (strain DSM 14365 / JCM 11303 / SMP-2) TaxID=502025 RepID=D0LJN5_HALO1|nr:elongation factor G [Haliangium ochraceum]ACY16609.1 small GTP-binding protein [Haliangium ochraceum DSM 14365]